LSIDRDAALKRAEKLLRQGKLDGAIEEYVRLVEDQPRDWNAINALGDLYLRAGQPDHAVTQFTRVADYLFDEGFLPKAAALYKKALKARSQHEPTLLRLGEIAARQGLLADARGYLRQLADQRRARGDQRGAAECLIRLGALEDADPEARMTAARAAQGIGQTRQAAALLKSAAEDLEREGRVAEALDALVDAAQLDPADGELRTRLARECVRTGQLDRARLFLTEELAGEDPELLLALARIEIASDHEPHARALLTRMMLVAPARGGAVVELAQELASRGRVDSAFGCVDVITDAALLAGDWDGAVDALQAFVRKVPHVPALIKLVEMCVDAGLDAPLRDAQAQLADAYLREEKGAEARFVTEDLLDREPGSAAHVQRLRRALELLGVDDIDLVIAERVQGDILGAPGAEPLELPGPEAFADVAPLPARISPGTPPLAIEPPTDEPPQDTIVLGAMETMEVDLSSALTDIGAAPRRPPPPPSPSVEGPPQDLESVFEDIRSRASDEQQASAAAAQYERGLDHLRHGRVADAVADLRAAARMPLLRFQAAAELGRLHISRGELQDGVDWLERAAEAPAPVPEAGFAVLYELAAVLERLGESARALAVLIELDADAGEYRDVRPRIDHLAKAQAGSRGR
jgi:tetratricopeptide (TPR) repeat protein